MKVPTPARPTYGQAQVLEWLAEIAAGVIHLDDDNEALALAATALIIGAQPKPPIIPSLPPGYLSPHFTLAELTASSTAAAQGIDNSPDEAALVQLQDLAWKTLEGIRKICGNNPVIVTSGYRSPALNAAVGGVGNSAHLYGAAADFSIPGFGDPTAICAAVKPHLVELGIDQLIDESSSDGGRWVHVGRAIPPSTEPRHQCFAENL
jgi:zinc D-Ala-D-Ala carboxypeptidase